MLTWKVGWGLQQRKIVSMVEYKLCSLLQTHLDEHWSDSTQRASQKQTKHF